MKKANNLIFKVKVTEKVTYLMSMWIEIGTFFTLFFAELEAETKAA